jgi:(R,R)-butanediol dehydrogenase/meso-butanediol dehydrogenase/diacetyl reductase
MKALRWYAREDMRLDDIPEPSPGPGQAKIKVHWTGICGSDIHEYEYGPIFVCTEPNPTTGRMAPITMGHEFAGDVVELGEGVTSVKIGDRVVGEPIWSCGNCFYCKRNMPHQCDKAAYTGFHADGSFAEFIIAPAHTLFKLPPSISYEVATLTEPLAIGLHAVRRSGMQVGDTVAIVGAGTIGLSTLLAARASGASKVYMLEVAEARKKRALDMGATAMINPKDVNPVEKVKELTDGLGVDIAFDCAGVSVSGPLAVDVARKVGTAVIVGMSPKPSPDFNFMTLQLTEKTVLGSIAYQGETQTAIDLIADGRVEPSGLITAKVALEDTVEKGIKALIEHPDKHIKILVES